MKKLTAILLLAAMLLSLAACRGNDQTAFTDPTAVPTDAPVITAAPTESPTEEPTEAPTSEPTATPAPRPEITELPETVNVADLTPVITIPLVYDTDYDPQNDCKKIEKTDVCGDGDSPIAVYGPTAYTVDEGRLIVLDAIGGVIRIYDLAAGEWVMNIDAASAQIDPLSNNGSIAFYNGLYWIYSAEKGFVVAVDEEGKVWKTISSPNAGNMDDYEDQYDYIEAWSAIFSAQLRVIDGELYLKTHGCAAYNMPDFKLEGDEFVPCEPKVKYTLTDYPDWYFVITKGKYKWYVPTDEDLTFGCTVREIDDEGNMYASCNLLIHDNMGCPHTEQTLRIYDKDSRLVGAFRYEMAEPIAYGTHIVSKDTEGVWIMCCTEDEVRIYELPFSSEHCKVC